MRGMSPTYDQGMEPQPSGSLSPLISTVQYVSGPIPTPPIGTKAIVLPPKIKIDASSQYFKLKILNISASEYWRLSSLSLSENGGSTFILPGAIESPTVWSNADITAIIDASDTTNSRSDPIAVVGMELRLTMPTVILPNKLRCYNHIGLGFQANIGVYRSNSSWTTEYLIGSFFMQPSQALNLVDLILTELPIYPGTLEFRG